ncbi:MAG TPA: alanine--tRNA ligase [Anaerolineales bacterium]|nr:alanine--tRNA ligase [Anaerolineales bacterium]
MKKRSAGPMTSREIRQSFLDFFARRDHTVVHSAPLVPASDPTLLFTNSGMVQFKDVFLGTGSRPYVRAVDSQKCLRVTGKHNDLDDVGRDDIHQTFFEMLGNWSFGDYYKAEAIPWAWQLLTEAWGLPKKDLYATCFADEKGEIPRDDEAAEIWRQQPGFDPSHVAFFGRNENFWEMAEVGPCGPDSEMHIDRGPAACDKQGVPGHVCRLNGDCQRYVELWNLVFIQYNRLGPTALEPLPKRHVDTGMGFERLVSVLQGVSSNYATDLFQPILQSVQRRLKHDDAQARELWTPYRVIADHGRAAAFLIADGVVPGNTGRNYVCRMIIRRAGRFGAKAGFRGPFLAEVARTVVEEYGEVYPELVRNQAAIERTITEEEERFQRTVDTGLARLDALLAEAAAQDHGRLDGRRAFDLYATYGLPLEISRDIARERGLEVDEVGFREAMDSHREASTAGVSDRASADVAPVYSQVLDGLQNQGVSYNPYGPLEVEGEVVALLREDESVAALEAGQQGAVVLPATSFYVAAGGQVSDTGVITSTNGSAWEFAVHDMREPVAGVILHVGEVVRGTVRAGERARASVDAQRRWDIMRNHTATHLLHAGLRAVLGQHARQAGSLVAPDRLRFDFTHPRPLTADEIRRVQQLVTEAIFENMPLAVVEKPRQEAEGEGAMALFGETYGETVRTISIGSPRRFSYELCGGTHVRQTGDIGPFVIVREESVGAGIRRIEALTGRQAQAYFERTAEALQRVADLLETTPEQAETQVATLLRERKALEGRVSSLQRQTAGEILHRLPDEQIGDARVLIGLVPGCSADDLRALSDPFRTQHSTHAVVLGSEFDGKPVLIASLSADLTRRGMNAVDLVKTAARPIGGGGGGRATMAQAGGKDARGLPEAIELARRWIEAHLAASPA